MIRNREQQMIEKVNCLIAHFFNSQQKEFEIFFSLLFPPQFFHFANRKDKIEFDGEISQVLSSFSVNICVFLVIVDLGC